jgi:hypothetical protein
MNEVKYIYARNAAVMAEIDVFIDMFLPDVHTVDEAIEKARQVVPPAMIERYLQAYREIKVIVERMTEEDKRILLKSAEGLDTPSPFILRCLIS